MPPQLPDNAYQDIQYQPRDQDGILSIYDSYGDRPPRNGSQSPPQLPPVTSSQPQRRPRPLPAVPGPPPGSGFPEAHPYDHLSPSDSGSSISYPDLRRSPPTPNNGPRRLPPHPGLPSSPYPPSNGSLAEGYPTLRPPTLNMPAPHIRQPSPHQSPSTPISRPSGAAPPSAPGFSNGSVSRPTNYSHSSDEFDPRYYDPTSTSQYPTGSLGRNTSLSSSYSNTITYPHPGAPVHEEEEYEEQPENLYRSPSLASQASVSRNSTRTSHSSVAHYPVRAETLTPQTSQMTASTSYPRPSYDSGYSGAGHSGPSRHNELDRIATLKGPLGLHEESDDEFLGDDSDEEDDSRFVNLALLSHLAVRLRDRVPRGTHVKGSIPYPRAFTGKDIVSTIQSQIQRELSITMGLSTSDRRTALHIARSLQGQLFFYEVEWGGKILSDGVEDVFMFLDDQEGLSDVMPEREELPTGVITFLTKCYSPSCQTEEPCYSYSCPKRRTTLQRTGPSLSMSIASETSEEKESDWRSGLSQYVLDKLPESEVKRQTIIHQVIKKEEQYVHDLDTIEHLFIRPLRIANPPVIPHDEIDEFIDTVFGNVLDIRECNRRLLEVMYVRQREQGAIVQRIGDVFLTAAAEFRLAYPIYVGHLPVAEKRVKDELETNTELRRFLDQCAKHPDSRRFDLKHFLSRPSEHLQKYPVLLEAIMQETTDGNPDVEYLQEAVQAIRNLSTVATLWTFQNAMGKGPTSKLQWHDIIPKDYTMTIPKSESKRQSIIWELIQGEMLYVRDLELIETIFVRPLRSSNPPIVPLERLSDFLHDVFHNFMEIHSHHRRLLDRLHEIQREEHPRIRTVTAPVFDAALNWRDAYLEYIPNHPIATYRVDEEMAQNPLFKSFIEQCTRHPDAQKLDIKNFIMRPVARLLRYPLLLSGIMDASPAGHEDKDSIPNVLEVIKDLGKSTEGGVESSKQKVELWRYDANLVFKPGEYLDMDLKADTRSLIHAGKLLRQPESGLEWNGWSELYVLLFDNYLVMTKTKEKDGVTKYHVNRRPIPLDLLSLATFSDPAQQRGTAFLKGFRGGDRSSGTTTGNSVTGANGDASDSRAVWPCTIHHNGRMGGLYTLYTETADARAEWKKKLEEALALRAVIQDSNKVFEIEPLSADTFLVPSMQQGMNAPAWDNEQPLTGKVTCSVPFSTADGRGLVAIGCAEGVWIGLRHDTRSMKRVLHLRQVTQCAMLEDFGIFLVLADKALFAYHIEALVPSSTAPSTASTTPQKLNGHKDVQFFSVGSLHGRTLIIYMKKKGLDSVFRVLEPVVGKIAEKAKNPTAFSRWGIGSQKSDWFRVYRDFFLPSESYDLIFLKARIAILCTKGFEIMDLTDFKSVSIPQRDDPRLQALAKRCESCKPLGMYRSSENEFLLCYDQFGLYVDRHGYPSRQLVTIEWEGTAERVAFHPPYLLLFDSRFIEVRHIDNGRLAQIIPGSDVRCTWDGRGGSGLSQAQTPGPEGWQETASQEPRVHGVMKAPDPPPGAPGKRPRAVVQQVFELVPTIPLFLPGSLQSPSTTTYFPPASPPRSPRLHAAASLSTSNGTWSR